VFGKINNEKYKGNIPIKKKEEEGGDSDFLVYFYAIANIE
jgi:hypothetical protein